MLIGVVNFNVNFAGSGAAAVAAASAGSAAAEERVASAAARMVVIVNFILITVAKRLPDSERGMG